jgi:hypothetical protein
MVVPAIIFAGEGQRFQKIFDTLSSHFSMSIASNNAIERCRQYIQQRQHSQFLFKRSSVSASRKKYRILLALKDMT